MGVFNDGVKYAITILVFIKKISSQSSIREPCYHICKDNIFLWDFGGLSW